MRQQNRLEKVLFLQHNSIVHNIFHNYLNQQTSKKKKEATQIKIGKGFEVFQKKAYKWSMSPEKVPEKVLNTIVIREIQMEITVRYYFILTYKR